MTDSDPDSPTITNRSGGADLNAGRDIIIGGDVVGRDKITITEEAAHRVEGLANPYLGLQSFTYADCTKYAGREKTDRRNRRPPHCPWRSAGLAVCHRRER